MTRFLWICAGGAAGTGARYVLSGWALRALGAGFPYGTLAVNVLGSFAVGLLMQIGLATPVMSPAVEPARAVAVWCRPGAAAFVGLFSMLSSLLSWSFSLIFSALLAKEVTHRVRGADGPKPSALPDLRAIEGPDR